MCIRQSRQIFKKTQKHLWYLDALSRNAYSSVCKDGVIALPNTTKKTIIESVHEQLTIILYRN